MKLKVSELIASCLQRMISDEIENQKWWRKEDQANGLESDIRDTIIEELSDLSNQIEEQGVNKYIRP